MNDKYNTYTSIISPGVVEICSNVKIIHGFYHIKFDIPEYSKSISEIKLTFLVKEIFPQPSSSYFRFGNIFGEINTDYVIRKFHLPFSIKATMQLSAQKTQTTLTVNSAYYRLGKIRVNDFCPPGIHLRDLLAASLIGAGYVPVHSASFVNGDKGIMLVGTGGIGKTHLLLLALQQGSHYLADDMTIVNNQGDILPSPGMSSICYEHGMDKLLSGRIRQNIRKVILMEQISNIFPQLKYLLQTPYVEIRRLVPQLELGGKTKARKIFILSKGNSSISKLSKEQAFNMILQINRLEFPYYSNQMLLSFSTLNQWFDVRNLMHREEALIKNLVTGTDCYLCMAPNSDEHFKVIQRNM